MSGDSIAVPATFLYPLRVRSGMSLTLGIHNSVAAVFPPEQLRDALDGVGAEVRIVDTDGCSSCDGVVTFTYEEGFLDADLAWIHSIQAGVDRFPFDAFRERDIALTNSTGIHGDVIGETVLGYMLAFARRLHAHRSNQERNTWQVAAWDEAFPLRGESVCVVGLGTLGRGVAVRADALGMNVSGVKRTPTPVDGVDRVYPAGDLHEAISDARFVAITVPLTDATEGLIGRAELETMREDAYLINVARGPVVDQPALVSALEAEDIAGAALDVFETEPLPSESPLWEMNEVIVTPHSAAFTRDYYERIAALVRENCRRLDAGESLANRVL